jgi:phage protein D
MFNYITVEFPDSQVPPQRVSEIVFEQEYFTHEVAYIKFRDWDIDYQNVKSGSPVKFTIKTTGASRVFYGYVQSVVPKLSPGKRFLEMAVIGASYKLKQARQAVYTDVTADRVVAEIAKANSFAYDADAHPRVYEQVAQAGHTDLEILTRVAYQAGYGLRLENTTIHFKPYDYDYINFRQSAPVLTLRDANNPKGTDIYSFNATISESNMYENGYMKSAIRVGGVDARSRTGIQIKRDNILTYTRTETQNEFFDRFATNVVAPATDIAFYEARAIEHVNGYPYRALVSIQGNPTLRPGSPVFLDGVGTGYSGYWTVISTKHIIVEESRNQFKYVTHMVVGADSLSTQSAPYTDVSEVPRLQDVRILTPGVRSVPEADTNQLSVTNAQVSKSEQTQFVNTKNGKTKVTKQGSKKKPVWKNSKNNLKATSTRYARRSQIAVERLRGI